ncbi:glycosyltransferase [Candidatus Woesearchaeota archaeon]|nr:glycosyltransferase [Candidatus Woesearchaeota archaeon]
MMRVLALASTFPRWKNDTEPDFVYWLESLLAKDFEITVLAPHHKGARLSENIGGLKVRRFRYFIPKYERLCYEGGIRPNMQKSLLARLQLPFLLISEFAAVKMLLPRNRFDLIHAHWILPQGLVAVLAKKIFSVPVIVTVHAGDVFPLKSPFFRALAKWTLKNADEVTVNSRATAEAVRRVADVRMQIIPMGVDLKLFSSGSAAKIRKKYGINGKALLFVGRLAEKKGVAFLVSAMKRIVRKYPSCTLLIVGDGPERHLLERQVRSLNLSKNIIFAGSVPKKELPAFYRAADVFVLPSIVARSGDTEGLGVVLLEALASGTPVAASNVGGIPDIVIDNSTGLLFPQKNPDAIAASVLRILGSKALSNKLVRNAKKRIIRNFSWNVVAEKFRKIYLRGSS